MPERRQHAFTNPRPGVNETYRQEVEKALRALVTRAELEAAIDAIDIPSGGVTDHGALTGLGDDDHTQYALAGAVGSSRLTQATARLLGRTTAGTGAVEAITVGTGLDLSAGSLTNTVSAYTDEQVRDVIGAALVEGIGVDIAVDDAANTITLAATYPQTIYEVDFTAQANNTFANGTEVIDGLSWTAANVASLATFDILNGTGLRMVAGTNLGAANTYTTVTRNAPHISIPLSSIPNWDGRFNIIIEIALASGYVLEGNGESIMCGLYSPATNTPNASSIARLRSARIANNSSTIVGRMVVNATETNATPATTARVISTRIDSQGGGYMGLGSAYSSGWPTIDAVLNYTVQSDNLSPFNYSGVVLFLGLGVINDASPTTRATVERLRVMRV